MANKKVQLLTKDGSTLDPVTRLSDITFTSAGGIKFTSSTNTLTTSRIPQANIYGLTGSLGNLQNKLSAGFGMIVSGATVGQARFFDIQSNVTGGTVTLSAGCGYNIYANGAVVTLSMESYEASHPNQVGLEGHARIYLTGSAYLKTDSTVVIGTPLTYNAYNNCTLRFHDGHCIVDLEDTTSPA